MNAGYLPEIMDGLLAEKKVKPMLVVMPNGHPDEPGRAACAAHNS
jgi:enterochelin esterase-like enzyme